MVSWAEFEREAPDLAARVRERFQLGTNKTMATLRKDGSPRISATELEFGSDDVTFGMMGGSMKLRDVRRDARIAIHSPTIEPPAEGTEGWPGDAKLAGRAVEIPPPPNDNHVGAGFFRVDLSEVALTYVGEPADHLVVECWHPDRGCERRRVSD